MELPPGEIKQDPNFGEMLVFHNSFDGKVLLNHAGTAPTNITLLASYQGCSEQGLCYAPIKKTLEIDLSANLLARNKQSPWYLDAVDLSANYHKLKSLQCPDNLVRARLIRAWEGVKEPKLRMRLVLHPRGRYVYDVAPHSLFMGGIQLDVQAFLEDESETTPASTSNEASPVAEADPQRKHAS